MQLLDVSIDYKKVKLTYDEKTEYERMVKSYTSTTQRGEELFRGMFEVNDDGIITMIRALGEKRTSFEVVFFLLNIMQNQWLREMAIRLNEHISTSSKQIDDKLLELDKKILELEEKYSAKS